MANWKMANFQSEYLPMANCWPTTCLIDNLPNDHLPNDHLPNDHFPNDHLPKSISPNSNLLKTFLRQPAEWNFVQVNGESWQTVACWTTTCQKATGIITICQTGFLPRFYLTSQTTIWWKASPKMATNQKNTGWAAKHQKYFINSLLTKHMAAR